jgi:hypothetical protein
MVLDAAVSEESPVTDSEDSEDSEDKRADLDNEESGGTETAHTEL